MFNKENVGPGGARNRGLSISRTKYIGFADSDDYFIGVFDEHKFYKSCKLKADLIPIQIINPMKEASYKYSENKLEVLDIDGFLGRRSATVTNEVWGYLYRREFLIKSNCEFIKAYYGEDVAFLSRVFSSKPKIIEASICKYLHSASIGLSRSIRSDKLYDLNCVLGELTHLIVKSRITGNLLLWVDKLKLEILEQVEFCFAISECYDSDIFARSSETYNQLGLCLMDRVEHIKSSLRFVANHCATASKVYLYCLSDRSILLGVRLASTMNSNVSIIDDVRHGFCLHEGLRIECSPAIVLAKCSSDTVVVIVHRKREICEKIVASVRAIQPSLRILSFDHSTVY